MHFNKAIVPIAVMACSLGGASAAQQTRLQTKLGFSVVSVERCSKTEVSGVKKYREARSARSTCMMSGANWDIAVMLSEASAPVTSVPVFRSKSVHEIAAMGNDELQELLAVWLKSNLRDARPQGASGWSVAPAKVQRISKGTLAGRPYVCARYTHASRHSAYKLKADAIGERCARLSKDAKLIEEVAVQTTVFFSLGRPQPENFSKVAERAISSLHYRR